MTRYCTWKRCGAPATKMIRIRLRYPERVIDAATGEPVNEAKIPRELWRCDEHYEEAVVIWEGMEDVFIVEY